MDDTIRSLTRPVVPVVLFCSMNGRSSSVRSPSPSVSFSTTVRLYSSRHYPSKPTTPRVSYPSNAYSLFRSTSSVVDLTQHFLLILSGCTLPTLSSSVPFHLGTPFYDLRNPHFRIHSSRQSLVPSQRLLF